MAKEPNKRNAILAMFATCITDPLYRIILELDEDSPSRYYMIDFSNDDGTPLADDQAVVITTGGDGWENEEEAWAWFRSFTDFAEAADCVVGLLEQGFSRIYNETF